MKVIYNGAIRQNHVGTFYVSIPRPNAEFLKVEPGDLVEVVITTLDEVEKRREERFNNKHREVLNDE